MANRDTPRGRRLDFSRRLRKKGVGLAVVSNPRHILYLTGLPSNMDMYLTLQKGQRSTSFLAVSSEGESSLFLGESETRNPFTGARVPLARGFDGAVFTYPDKRSEISPSIRPASAVTASAASSAIQGEVPYRVVSTAVV